jgi:hypothetical protein
VTRSEESRIVILGAGCSANLGFPLGKGLANELREFQSELADSLPLIKRGVSDTTDLAESLPQLDTLDQLTKHCEDDFHSWRQREGSMVWDEASKQRDNLLAKRIVDAKIAICAMFVAREGKARKIGLGGYDRFIASIFGGDPWEEAVKTADCHVLSFNYDRLFEVAFLNHFKSFDIGRVSLYGNSALNSGFNHRSNGGFDCVEPASGRFNFLKLHGSAGWWVKKSRDERDRRLYWPTVPTEPINLQDIEAILAKREGIFAWEPLITFPHEKHVATESDSTNFAHDPYIRRIWNQAAGLLETATDVRVIGYSFSAIDSRHMVQNLLTKAARCEKIIIQNPDVTAVKANLRSYKQLAGRLEFDSSPFGESL